MIPLVLSIVAYFVSEFLKQRQASKDGQLKVRTPSMSLFNNAAKNTTMINAKTTLILLFVVIACKIWMIQNFSHSLQISMHICILYFIVQTFTPIVFFVNKYDKFKSALDSLREIFI